VCLCVCVCGGGDLTSRQNYRAKLGAVPILPSDLFQRGSAGLATSIRELHLLCAVNCQAIWHFVIWCLEESAGMGKLERECMGSPFCHSFNQNYSSIFSSSQASNLLNIPISLHWM
jgi:hypothetical protein